MGGCDSLDCNEGDDVAGASDPGERDIVGPLATTGFVLPMWARDSDCPVTVPLALVTTGLVPAELAATAAASPVTPRR